MIYLKLGIKPISINEAFQGRRFKTKKCKKFEEDLSYLLPAKKCIPGKVQVRYKFYLKNHALTDYDNMIKVMQDSLVKKGYIEDDRKIYRAMIDKIPSKENFIEILIKEL